MVVKEKVILGIDPGTINLGYGIISVYKNNVEMVTMGTLNLDKFEDHCVRLKKIYDRITSIIEEFEPEDMAVEAPFFGKNVQAMLKLGRAQGVAILSALNKNIKTTEYSPRRIKQAITGNGSASKEQVAYMLKKYLNINDVETRYLDETDALAVALCHHFLSLKGNVVSTNSTKNWKDFIKNNPDRIKK